jgi:methionyl-tRNA formyltransferase
MGTPEFSIPVLKKLIESQDHKVVGVFTQSPKARGRGLIESDSPVHNLANSHNIPVYTPSTLRNREAFELIDPIEADIIVVVAYGFIIPENILNSKKHGCLNIHPSKLPKYRGAAPLQRTIINGEKSTAVCIMQMDTGLDTGGIILQENFELSARTTFAALHDKCAEIGAELLVKVLNEIDTLPRIPQSTNGVSYAHKLNKSESKIDWTSSSYQIDCKIRGMNPWPGTYFEYDGKIVKILQSNYKDLKHTHKPGLIINDQFEVACGEGILLLEKLQLPGKAPLFASEFFRGFKVLPGTYLT